VAAAMACAYGPSHAVPGLELLPGRALGGASGAAAFDAVAAAAGSAAASEGACTAI